MDRVIEELDDAKAEMERLRVECRMKAELVNSLKRSHSEQLQKIQELNLELEKQSHELNAKTGEVYVAVQLLEDFKRILIEKEAIIKGLNASSERLRTDSNEKLRICEEEKSELVFLLENANSNNLDLERKLRVLEEEMEGIKERFVSVSQKKCSEANKVAKASKEMRRRDDMLIKLEEENRKLEDQLKWKKEQFAHLEEAHQKLRDHLRAKEAEWDIEKSTLLDEISTLQMNLDSQIRVSEGLQKRLEICNQSLAHEENRRKFLEIQLSESKHCFENIFLECEDAKSKIESLTSHRDKDIVYLRNLLGEKEVGCKEMEYRVGKLEEENQELKISLKELREAQVQEAGNSKLRNKLKSLEQVHRDCSKRLKEKETEWNSRLETVINDLNFCRSELESKDSLTKQLKTELDDCNSLITSLILEKEESCITALVLKSQFWDCSKRLIEKEAEWNSGLEKVIKDLNFCRSELESKDSLKKQLEVELDDCNSLISSLILQKEESCITALVLKSQLLEAQSEIDDGNENDLKSIALLKTQENLEEEREKLRFREVELLRKVELLRFANEEKLLLQKDIEGHKEMLKESSACQERLKEELLLVKSELSDVSNLLNEANDELDQIFCDRNEVEFELQIWKSMAERLKAELEQNHQMRREVEASLLAQVSTEVSLRQEKDGLLHVLEERETRINQLQQKLVSMETAISARKQTESVRGAREKAYELEKEMELWEQEWLQKELEGAILAQIDAEKIHQQEKESLNQIVEEKDQRINDLQKIMSSLEEDFEHSSTSFSSHLVKMQAEIDVLHKAWEKMATTQVLKEIETEEKNLMIVELENDSSTLQQKLEHCEKSLCSLKARREELEAELKSSDALVQNLDVDKRNLLENVVRLSSERDSLLGLIEELSDRIGKFSSVDAQTMGTLGRIVQVFNEPQGDELFDPTKENLHNHPSPTEKRVETTVEERSPLRARNY